MREDDVHGKLGISRIGTLTSNEGDALVSAKDVICLGLAFGVSLDPLGASCRVERGAFGELFFYDVSPVLFADIKATEMKRSPTVAISTAGGDQKQNDQDAHHRAESIAHGS